MEGPGCGDCGFNRVHSGLLSEDFLRNYRVFLIVWVYRVLSACTTLQWTVTLVYNNVGHMRVTGVEGVRQSEESILISLTWFAGVAICDLTLSIAWEGDSTARRFSFTFHRSKASRIHWSLMFLLLNIPSHKPQLSRIFPSPLYQRWNQMDCPTISHFPF